MAIINYITTVQFDFGAIALLPQECERIGMQRALVVTDPGVRSAGFLDRVTAQLNASFQIFDRTPSNPTESAVRDAVEAYRAHNSDGVVAVGGGSSIDLAKAAA